MRRAFYLVHLYSGLFAGLFVALVGATGSAVVYRPEIERLLYPEWFRVQPKGEPRPLDELAANAVATYPGAKPTFVAIHPPLAPDEPAMVVMKERFGEGSGPWVRTQLDPYSGAVLASFLPGETFSGMLFNLHSSLLVGEHSWGEQIVGVAGIVLLVFCATGAVLWWPGLRRLRRGFEVRASRGPFILNYDLHRVLGIALLIPLGLVAVTGIVLVFPQYTKAPILKALRIERPPRPPQASGLLQRVSLEQVKAIVAGKYPAATLVTIQLPGDPKSAYQARLLLPGDPKVRYGGGAKLAIWIDAGSGEILMEHDVRSMPASSRLMFEWIFPTHTGDIAGEIGRLVMFISGLLPLFLFLSGLYIWSSKRARPTALRRSTPLLDARQSNSGH